MTPRAVVPDASVAVKWLVDEPGSAAALEWRDAADVAFHVPDLWHLEIASALWKRLRRVDPAIRAGLLHDAVAALATLKATVHPATTLVERAISLALEAGISVYDASYAAVAERAQATLVTADTRLVRALAGRTTATVELLGEVLP